MVIETKRLILREYNQNDFEDLAKILTDPETMIHYPAPYDLKKVQRWIDWNLDNYQKYGFGLWAINLKDSNEFIGDCGITIQNIDNELLPEVGYHINKKYWRLGYAKEAGKAVVDWAFNNTSFKTLYSYMKYTNIPSSRTALSLGMKKIKEYQDKEDLITYVYSIDKEEWLKIVDI